VKPRPHLQRAKPGCVYFRFGGKTIARLPGVEGSPEFEAAYARLKAEHAKVVVKRKRIGRPPNMHAPEAAKRNAAVEHRPDGQVIYKSPSIGWVIERWLASVRFAPPGSLRHRPGESFAISTQADYRLFLDQIKRDIGDLLLTDLTPHAASLYIEQVNEDSAERGRGGSKAERHRTVLSLLWRFANHKLKAEIDLRGRSNPLINGEIERVYTPTEIGHKPWPETVWQAFIAHCDENAWLAVHLLRHTGQRISDVVKMRWSDLRNDGTHLHVVQKKDRANRPMVIALPQRLRKMIDQRSRSHDGDFILTHAYGRPYDSSSLSHRIKDVLRVVAPNGKFSPEGLPLSDYTAHGLRKNCGITLALGGATNEQIMAHLGHKTIKQALHYTKLADQQRHSDVAASILDRAFADHPTDRAMVRRRALKAV
jgi:integrase